MPNHVTHRMNVRGDADAIKAFIERFLPTDEEGNQGFDFNAIVPRPAILDRTISPSQVSENGRQMLRPVDAPEFSFQSVEATEEEQAELDALEHRDWYNWTIANWGTKWGAYSFRMVQPETPEHIEFMFDTAWSPPTPVLEKLTELCPDIEFDVDAFDEGWCFAYHGGGADGVYTDMSLEATDERYEQVYGEPPEKYDDEDEEAA